MTQKEKDVILRDAENVLDEDGVVAYGRVDDKRKRHY